jgi:hypothetical protein
MVDDHPDESLERWSSNLVPGRISLALDDDMAPFRITGCKICP